MNKRCNVCGGEFPADTEHFHRDRTRPDALACRCKSCHKDIIRRQRQSEFVRQRDRDISRRWREAHPEETKERYREHRRKIVALLQELRATLRCERCGAADDLHFHHRVPAEKSFAIGDCTHSWDSMLEEMKKCDVLCRTCHIREHVRMRKELRSEAVAS